MRIRLIPCFLLALAPACSSDDKDPNNDPVDADVTPQPDADPACPDPTAVLPNEWRPINSVSAGAVETIDAATAYVDATAGGFGNTADNPYIYVRFDAELTKVEITDIQSYTDSSWDLAFKRTVIRANNGDSGPGNLQLAVVDAETLEEVTEFPADALLVTDDWVSDACVYQGGLIGEPLTAVGSWYSYDETTNQPTPLPLVFVAKRPDGTAFKFEIDTYYYNGLPGANFAVRWAPL